MSGTVSFTGGFDPVVFIGWYHSTNLNERIGIGVANPIPAGTGIRWQTQSGNVAGTGVVSQNFGANTTVSTYAPGTYPFTFTYDGIGHMAGTFNGVNFARNYAAPTNLALQMDRFGFLQKSTSDDNVNTITLNISNISYTGQTDVGAGVPGDYNGNGSVDPGDYVVWRKGSIAADGTGPSGTPDGIVDALDYDYWRALRQPTRKRKCMEHRVNDSRAGVTDVSDSDIRLVTRDPEPARGNNAACVPMNCSGEMPCPRLCVGMRSRYRKHGHSKQ